MLAQHIMPCGVVGQVALITDIFVIFSARGDMGDFVMCNDFKDAGTFRIPMRQKPFNGRRRGIKAACLKHHRHDRQTRQNVIGRIHRCLPKPVVCGKVTICRAQFPKAFVDHFEMARFVIGDLNPGIVKITRHVCLGKAHTQIPCEIDGIEFDVGQRMQKANTSLNAAFFALGHLVGRQQFRLCRTTGTIGQIS